MAETEQINLMQGNTFSEETLTVAISCLIQCVMELLADGELLQVSMAFRFFIFFAVGVNILKGYIGAGYSVPSKMYYGLLGYTVYLIYWITR